MVQTIRDVESCLGSAIKQPTTNELQTRLIARKSIVALRNIQVGEIYSAENLTIKRPGNGINPMKWYDLIGQKANRSYVKDELIEL